MFVGGMGIAFDSDNSTKEHCTRPMTHRFFYFAMAMWLSVATSALASTTPTHEDLSAQKELLQLKLDANKELLLKELEAKTQRIESFDKRLEDQTARIGDVSASIDRFGLLVTVLLAAVGFLGYFSITAKARDEARSAANDAAEKWFADKAQELSQEIKQLKEKAAQARIAIDADTQAVADRGAKAREQIGAEAEATKAALQANMLIPGSTNPESISVNSSALNETAERLKNRPENTYSFDDWDTRAFDAYSRQELSEAALYWGKASEVPTAGASKVARAMFNKGVTLGQLGRNDEALAIYEAVISHYEEDTEAALRGQVARSMVNKGSILGELGRFDEALAAFDTTVDLYGADTEAALREQVARALLGKGVALENLERNDEAIAVYDAVIANYAANTETALREQVARAMLHKGTVLGQLGRSDEELAVYDSVIANYAADTETTLREQVAIAMNAKGFVLLCAAKRQWTQTTAQLAHLEEARTYFDKALAYLPNSALVKGNRAYAAWLQGESMIAETWFVQALRADGGGEKIYKATLKDLDIHPIAEDEGFRTVINRCWADFNSSKTPH